MKKITKYQANDGSEWHSGAEAMERDAQGREHDQPYFAYGAGKDEKRWNYPCILDRREAK